jgi:hypothetical protein
MSTPTDADRRQACDIAHSYFNEYGCRGDSEDPDDPDHAGNCSRIARDIAAAMAGARSDWRQQAKAEFARPEVIAAVRRRIALEMGDDIDIVPKDKADWINTRGKGGGKHSRDINMPMGDDYSNAAAGALAAALEVP